jgi:hypothetical protein
MKRFAWVAAVCAFCLAGIACGATQPEALAAALSPDDQKAIEEVSRQFIGALVRNDRPTLLRLAPQRVENRWGNCPFASAPTLEKVVVDKSKAGVFFSGGHQDPMLPQKSLFALVLVIGDKECPWKVRSLLWYEQVPKGVRLPAHSITDEDRANEKVALRCVHAYIEAWRRSDFQFMDRMTYHWIEYSDTRKRPIRLRGVDFGKITGSSQEARVVFTARLRVLRVIPYKVDGMLEAVREDGKWKVRESSIAF